MGIKHADVKATSDRGYAAEWNKDHVIGDDVEFDKNQGKEFVADNEAAAPAGPVVGQLWYDTTTNVLKVWNGTIWVDTFGEDAMIMAWFTGW